MHRISTATYASTYTILTYHLQLTTYNIDRWKE